MKLLTFFYMFFFFSASGIANAQTPEKIKSGQYEISIAKAPVWLKAAPTIESLLDKARTPVIGFRSLLIDSQMDFRGASKSNYVRLVSVISDQESLRYFGEFNISFSTVFNKATLHHVHVYRNGRQIDKLNKSAIKIIQEEKSWDQRVLQGYVKAYMPIQDLRIGDVLDTAYSVDGDNPILGKKIRESIHLQGSEHRDIYRARLLIDNTRTLTVKSFNGSPAPLESRHGNVTEYLFEHFDIKPYKYEKDTPYWAENYPFVQISEYKDWAEVVDWGVRLFAQSEKPSQRVKDLAATWVAQTSDPQLRVAKALKYVQDEIRYLSTSIGSYAYLPQSPDVVLDKRYGDCKDKSNLFVALVRAMGYVANPVLVSTSQRHIAAMRLPGPQLFDHAVSNVVIDGQTYWLDPTMNRQPLSLTQGSFDQYDYGLVLKAGGADLTPINIDFSKRNLVESQFTYDFTAFNKPIVLTAEITMMGRQASYAKTIQESGQLDRSVDSVVNTLSRVYTGFKITDPVKLTDVPNKGSVTLTFKGLIDNAFYEQPQRAPAISLAPAYLWDMLRLGVSNERRSAIAIAPFPMRVVHRDVLNFPEPVVLPNAPLQEQVLDNSELAFSRSLQFDERQTRIEQQLIIKRDYLQANEIASSLAARNRVWDKLIVSYRPFPKSLEAFYKELDLKTRTDFPPNANVPYSAILKRRYSDAEKVTEAKLERFAFDSKSKADDLRKLATDQSLGGNKQKALATIEQALAFDPRRADFISFKGQMLFTQGQFQAAVTQLKAALAIDGQDSETHWYLGLAQFYLGDYSAALASQEKRLQLTEDVGSKWFALIGMKLAADYGKIAFDELEKKYLPNLNQKREFPAAVYDYLKGAITDADFDRAAKVTNQFSAWRNRSEMHYYKAHRLFLAGKKEAAKAEFQKVLELDVIDFIETTVTPFDLVNLAKAL